MTLMDGKPSFLFQSHEKLFFCATSAASRPVRLGGLPARLSIRLWLTQTACTYGPCAGSCVRQKAPSVLGHAGQSAALTARPPRRGASAHTLQSQSPSGMVATP